MNSTRRLVLSALFLALGILLPFVFHATGIGGASLLPMHLPVLLAGFIVGPFYGLVIGFTTPLLSGLLIGMPPFAPIPVAAIMAFELAAYGFFAGLFYEKLKISSIPSLVLAMICGRVVYGLCVFVLIVAFGFVNMNVWVSVWGAVVTGWPGILAQLVLVSAIALGLERSGFLKGHKLS